MTTATIAVRNRIREEWKDLCKRKKLGVIGPLQYWEEAAALERKATELHQEAAKVKEN